MSPRSIVFAFLVACSSHHVAPPSPPNQTRHLTHDECVAGVDHAIELLATTPEMAAVAEAMKSARADHVAQCQAVATQRDRECLMHSSTAYELGLCPMPGSR